MNNVVHFEKHDQIANLAANIFSRHLPYHGSTTFNDGSIPTTGFSVSVYPEYELQLKSLRVASIASYISDHWDLLQKPNHAIGTWFNTENKTHYLDIVILVHDKDNAREFAEQHNQLAFFDLGNKEEIRL